MSSGFFMLFGVRWFFFRGRQMLFGLSEGCGWIAFDAVWAGNMN
jgi:hypothetical protein